MTKKKLVQTMAVTATAATVLVAQAPLQVLADTSGQGVSTYSGYEYNDVKKEIANGAFIADPATQVTGLVYDGENHVLKWDTIGTNSEYHYVLTVINNATGVQSTYTAYSNYFNLLDKYAAGTNLTVSVQARHDYFDDVTINNVDYYYYYDEAYKLHTTTLGNPATVGLVLPAKEQAAVVNHLGTLSIDDTYDSSYSFKTSVQPNDGVSLELWYSVDPNFNNYEKKTEKKNYYENISTTGSQSSLNLSFSSLLPGTTYYVKARTKTISKVQVTKEVYDAFEGDKNSEWGSYDSNGNSVYNYYIEQPVYSDFTNTVTVKLPVTPVSISADVKTTSITLDIDADNDDLKTGYEIARKEGSKYVVIAKITGNRYENTGLKADTKYSYRVRAYSYDAKTKKYTYGESTYISRTTWGSDLKLQITQTGKSSAKLSWTKVAGADGYEIYRYTGTSYNDTIANGQSASYNKGELVKTITKASTTSYKATGLKAGEDYTYVVKAFKNVKSGKTTKQYFIEDVANLALTYESLTNLKTKTNSTGDKTISWSPAYSADGIVVEQYDEKEETWVTYKKLKNTTKSVTLKSDQPGKTVKYRIYTYKGNRKGEINTYYVTKYLATPTNVKAKKTSDGKGVTVSWSPVAGADYYIVYRSTELGTYNSDTKSYTVSSGESVPVFTFKEGDELDNAFEPEYSYYYEVPYSYDSANYTYVYNWSAATKLYYSQMQVYQEKLAAAQAANDAYNIQYYQERIAALNKNMQENPTEDIYNVKKTTYIKQTSVTDAAVVKTNDAIATLNVKAPNNSEAVASAQVITSARKGNVTTFYEGPEAGTTYYYYVKAYKYTDSYESTYNNIGTATSIGYSKPAKITLTASLSTPKISSVKSTVKNKATVKWGTVKNATKYEVYRSTSKKGTYTKVATVSSKTKSYTDKKVTGGKTYYYKIRAYKTTEAGADSYSSYSTVKSVKVKAAKTTSKK